MAAFRTIREKPRNRPRYTPVRVLGVFLVGIAAATLVTARQARERDLLETTEAPTGVGDQALFEIHLPFVPRRPVAEFPEGQPWFPQARDPVSRPDPTMRKVAWWRQFHLYRDTTESAGHPWLYVKTDKERYWPLGRQPIAEEEADATQPSTPPDAGR